MILPLVPAAIIALAASWMPISTPRAFTSMTLCQVATLASRKGSGLLKPALLTITLIVPNWRVHASMAALTDVPIRHVDALEDRPILVCSGNLLRVRLETDSQKHNVRLDRFREFFRE